MRGVCSVSMPRGWLVLIIHVLLSTDFVPAAPEARLAVAPDFKELGISYTLKKSTSPVPNRISILRTDRASRKVEPVVVLGADPDGDGPAEASLTDPRKMASVLLQRRPSSSPSQWVRR